MKNYIIITRINATNSVYASGIVNIVLKPVLVNGEVSLMPGVDNTIVLKNSAVSTILASKLSNELHTLGIDVTFVSEEEEEEEYKVSPKMDVLLMHVKDEIAYSNFSRYMDTVGITDVVVPFLFGRDVYNPEINPYGYLDFDFNSVTDLDKRSIKDAIVSVSEFILSEIDEASGDLDVTFNILVDSVVDYASELYNFSQCREIVGTLYDKGVTVNIVTKQLDDFCLTNQQVNILGFSQDDLTILDELCVYKKDGESLIRKPVVKLMNKFK